MKLSVRESIDRIRTFSRVFVERPRFAMVISIVLTMAGVMAIKRLPISRRRRPRSGVRSVITSARRRRTSAA